MRRLETITINNFKSIRDQTLALNDLNIFIGGNGSGKSNLIGVFKFLREIVSGRLQEYTVQRGGASALLHFGRKVSSLMSFSLEFGTETRSNGYRISLAPTDDERLVITSEVALYHEKDRYPKPYDLPIASSSLESRLKQKDHICARQILADLESYRVYHFHDTSDSAPSKAFCDLEDNQVFRAQGENLAAFLFFLKAKHENSFRLIEDTVKQVVPFFGGFRLEPSRLNVGKIRLEWFERGIDATFGPHALSDGTLRFICLATLLLQPELPAIVLLDEPELGLHPAAIALLAELLSSAATRTQVLAATQSVTLVNQFGPESVWAAERSSNHESTFHHLSAADMSSWFDNYSLGELWEKNVLGARP